MKQYQVVMSGLSPVILHNDNLSFTEQVETWRKAPENKGNSKAGDDRSPAWTWIGYLYHDTETLGLPSDNLMTMLREGGAKVKKKGRETYKKQTQSGLILDQQQWELSVDGNPIQWADIEPLIGDDDFPKHIETAKKLGFELLVKRAKIGQSKHIRVRPMFRNWQASGSLTVLDEEVSGLNKNILEVIFNQCGALIGIGDWRPSSGASGTFGRFEVDVREVK